MIKQRLGFPTFTRILCVGFSKDVAWSFDPKILEKEILQFIKIMNSQRNTPLQSKRFHKLLPMTEIQKDIIKLTIKN